LLNGQQVGSLNVPAIRKSEDVEEVRRLLAIQEESNGKDREYIRNKISEKAVNLLNHLQRALKEEIFAMVMERGTRFVQSVLNELTTELTTLENVSETTCSLYGFKARLSQQGTNEASLLQAEQDYFKARERLRAMSGDAVRSAQKTFFRKSWQDGLNRVRNDCLSWMGETNQRTLQLQAQRQAANLYEQLGDYARKLKSTISGIQQSLERVVERLEETAQNNLKASSSDHGIYELTVEAVGADFIQSYYQTRAVMLDPAAVYRSFGKSAQVENLDHLSSWSEGEWTARLKSHARTYFAEEVENTSLLTAMTQFYGKQALQKIEEQFNRLVRYCHPFWQYDANSGIQGQEGKSMIGVEDENSDLLPVKYRDDPQYQVKSTGFKHRVDFARVQHGLPSFLLRDMQDYKVYYDLKRKGLDFTF
jgi:hypothetical protein